MCVFLRKGMSSLSLNKLKKKTLVEQIEKPKKKIDRFDGLSEEEVQKYTLSDYLEHDLDLVFVGINPSLMAAHRGRYYAGPGNHFYKLLHVSGLVPRYVTFEEDYKLLQYGIGLTNIVARATRSSADLKRTEIKEGALIVEEKLKRFKPKVAVFNGKCIYEVYANKTGSFNFGLQPERIGDTAVWVTPSSSARCSNFPRMEDKLHFYTGLKKYLQFLKGEIKDVDVKEFWYEGKCRPSIPSTSKMWRRKNVSAFLHGGRIANKETVCLDTSEEIVEIAHSTEFIVTKLMTKEDIKANNAAFTEKEKETEDSGASLSQESAEGSFDNNTLSQEENSNTQDSALDLQNSISLSESSNTTVLQTSATLASKLKTNGEKKKNTKRLSPKPISIRKNVQNNGASNFVSLIKERLQNKAHEVNSGNTNNRSNKRMNGSSVKTKLKTSTEEEEKFKDDPTCDE